MSDIARLAGVSSSAVSFALNGRPGVSDETRRRIVSIAEEMGWFPNAAARALTGSRVGTVGLALTRRPRQISVQPFLLSFISGLDAELSTFDSSLLLNIAADSRAEMARYRRWWSEGRIDGVVLLDLRVDDPRLAELDDIGLPFVAAGHPRYAGGHVAIWNDDEAAIHRAVDRLVELGHERLARVGERAEMAHTAIRNAAFLDACARHGLPAPRLLNIDAGAEAAASTLSLLREKNAPSAILYDSDVAAVAGLDCAKSLQVRVPQDLSIVAYDDSFLCEVAEPALSALSHDVYGYGSHVARALNQVVTHSPDARSELDSTPLLVERGSIGTYLTEA